MALPACRIQLFCQTFLFLFLSIPAKLLLDPADHAALSAVSKDLGIPAPVNSSIHPCNSHGVFCERRLSMENSYVLKVTRLNFKSRQLAGVLSPAIGQLSELKELSLSKNKLRHRIPRTIVDCKKLEILDLADNGFEGEIPSDLSSLIRLRYLDISSNEFSGDLSFLKHFPNLEKLHVANNLFTGRIPKSVSSFRNLLSFNFSGNQLLEDSMPLLKRIQYSGSDVPRRYIFAENRSEITRAPTAAPVPAKAPAAAKTSSAPSQAPANKIKKHKSRKKKTVGLILGFITGAVGGIVAGVIFSSLFKLCLAAVRGGGKKTGPAIFSPLIKKAEDLAFLEEEDGLSSMEIIGRGGCGEVYRAELPGSNGKWIAIKKIVQPPKDAAELAEEDSKVLPKKMRQIRSEINTVGQIRHKNLLPLLAHISRPDSHFLVYEYMKNGSLQDVLKQVEDGTRELEWRTRHKIALGIASGLEYLHISHSPCIIHRDLKPANILLDDGMEARIADFGLAKALPDAHTHVSTSIVAGTLGYIAPEYHQTLKFTDKCDIYSFGVILAVLVTGRLPSDAFFQQTEEMSLVKWMRNKMTSENPEQAINSKLLGNGYEQQMLLVLKIACFCTLDNPKQRPNSKDVSRMLSQIQQ